MMRKGDFNEGVRAVIIEKDNKPKWSFSHPSLVPSSLVSSFFPENK